ncbi:PEP-CTERM sorting domain-containing protein [Kaarinaea lacus]
MKTTIYLPGTILLCSFFSINVNALPINQVDYFSLSGNALIDFESVPGGIEPGTNYDGIIDLDGASFAEHFNGQTISHSGNSDIISGAPVGGLTLVAGVPNQNLVIVDSSVDPGGNVLAGVGTPGFPGFSSIGEGAIAILFDKDQSEFGFQSVGGNLGSATFEFWARDGSLIDTIIPVDLGVDFFGFSREDNMKDIAGISIWNTDPGGIAFNDIIFDVPGDTQIPEPGTTTLLALGLLGIGFASRRKRNP